MHCNWGGGGGSFGQMYLLLFCLTGSWRYKTTQNALQWGGGGGHHLVRCTSCYFDWFYGDLKKKKKKLQWERVCERVCMCVLDKEGRWMLASTALVVVWTAMYLTGCSNYLTGFHEPPLPHKLQMSHQFEKCLTQSQVSDVIGAEVS